jgi:hypothetical protein
VSRSRLSLFEVDRRALTSFSDELRAVLAADDRDGLVRMLMLDGEAAEAIRGARHAAFVFLAAASYPPSALVVPALRSAARQRALRHVWTSNSLSLEGRIRGFEALREDEETARLADALLDGAGVPWFLRSPAGTFGSLPDADRARLAEALVRLDDPPPELVELGEALDGLDGEALVHDTL